MGAIEDHNIYGLTVRESATDGSDFTNPGADYRRLFLGEDGALHLKDSAGSVTDVGGAGGDVSTDAIWDAAGDLVQGTGANTSARLALGAAGTVVRSTGSANAYAFPPGHEFAYAEITSNASITATSEATADTVVTAGAVTGDGSTVMLIEFYSPSSRPDSTGAGRSLEVYLYDGSSSIGLMGFSISQAANAPNRPLYLARRLTPSAASHTYSIRAIVNVGTGAVGAGAGGSGASMPAFIRITKV